MKRFEREFLIRLAPVWLACRWKVMGHKLHAWPHPSDLEFDLLGMSDYGTEMRLLCLMRLSGNRLSPIEAYRLIAGSALGLTAPETSR